MSQAEDTVDRLCDAFMYQEYTLGTTDIGKQVAGGEKRWATGSKTR